MTQSGDSSWDPCQRCQPNRDSPPGRQMAWTQRGWIGESSKGRRKNISAGDRVILITLAEAPLWGGVRTWKNGSEQCTIFSFQSVGQLFQANLLGSLIRIWVKEVFQGCLSLTARTRWVLLSCRCQDLGVQRGYHQGRSLPVWSGMPPQPGLLWLVLLPGM